MSNHLPNTLKPDSDHQSMEYDMTMNSLANRGGPRPLKAQNLGNMQHNMMDNNPNDLSKIRLMSSHKNNKDSQQVQQQLVMNDVNLSHNFPPLMHNSHMNHGLVNNNLPALYNDPKNSNNMPLNVGSMNLGNDLNAFTNASMLMGNNQMPTMMSAIPNVVVNDLSLDKKKFNVNNVINTNAQMMGVVNTLPSQAHLQQLQHGNPLLSNNDMNKRRRKDEELKDEHDDDDYDKDDSDDENPDESGDDSKKGKRRRNTNRSVPRNKSGDPMTYYERKKLGLVPARGNVDEPPETDKPMDGGGNKLRWEEPMRRHGDGRASYIPELYTGGSELKLSDIPLNELNTMQRKLVDNLKRIDVQNFDFANNTLNDIGQIISKRTPRNVKHDTPRQKIYYIYFRYLPELVLSGNGFRFKIWSKDKNVCVAKERSSRDREARRVRKDKMPTSSHHGHLHHHHKDDEYLGVGIHDVHNHHNNGLKQSNDGKMDISSLGIANIYDASKPTYLGLQTDNTNLHHHHMNGIHNLNPHLMTNLNNNNNVDNSGSSLHHHHSQHHHHDNILSNMTNMTNINMMSMDGSNLRNINNLNMMMPTYHHLGNTLPGTLNPMNNMNTVHNSNNQNGNTLPPVISHQPMNTPLQTMQGNIQVLPMSLVVMGGGNNNNGINDNNNNNNQHNNNAHLHNNNNNNNDNSNNNAHNGNNNMNSQFNAVNQSLNSMSLPTTMNNNNNNDNDHSNKGNNTLNDLRAPTTDLLHNNNNMHSNSMTNKMHNQYSSNTVLPNAANTGNGMSLPSTNSNTSAQPKRANILAKNNKRKLTLGLNIAPANTSGLFANGQLRKEGAVLEDTNNYNNSTNTPVKLQESEILEIIQSKNIVQANKEQALIDPVEIQFDQDVDESSNALIQNKMGLTYDEWNYSTFVLGLEHVVTLCRYYQRVAILRTQEVLLRYQENNTNVANLEEKDLLGKSQHNLQLLLQLLQRDGLCKYHSYLLDLDPILLQYCQLQDQQTVTDISNFNILLDSVIIGESSQQNIAVEYHGRLLRVNGLDIEASDTYYTKMLVSLHNTNMHDNLVLYQQQPVLELIPGDWLSPVTYSLQCAVPPSVISETIQNYSSKEFSVYMDGILQSTKKVATSKKMEAIEKDLELPPALPPVNIIVRKYQFNLLKQYSTSTGLDGITINDGNILNQYTGYIDDISANHERLLELRRSYRTSFLQWYALLHQGKQLCFHGFGSKIKLQQDFVRSTCTDGSVVFVNCYLSGYNLKGIIATMVSCLTDKFIGDSNANKMELIVKTRKLKEQEQLELLNANTTVEPVFQISIDSIQQGLLPKDSKYNNVNSHGLLSALQKEETQYIKQAMQTLEEYPSEDQYSVLYTNERTVNFTSNTSVNNNANTSANSLNVLELINTVGKQFDRSLLNELVNFYHQLKQDKTLPIYIVLNSIDLVASDDYLRLMQVLSVMPNIHVIVSTEKAGVLSVKEHPNIVHLHTPTYDAYAKETGYINSSYTTKQTQDQHQVTSATSLAALSNNHQKAFAHQQQLQTQQPHVFLAEWFQLCNADMFVNNQDSFRKLIKELIEQRIVGTKRIKTQTSYFSLLDEKKA